MPRTSIVDPRMPARLRQRFLNTPVTIQQYVDVPDGAGGSARTWVTYKTAKAAITSRPVRKEPPTGERLQLEIIHFVVVEYDSGITAKMRVLEGVRILEILGIEDFGEQKLFLGLDCQERGQVSTAPWDA